MSPPLATRARGAVLAGLTLLGGCFYPDYSFDEPGSNSASSGTSSVGGAATSSTTASTGTAGGEAGGGPPVEDCFNGTDDDGDGLADCADDDCDPTAECVDAIPVGWGTLGYVSLYQGALGSEPPCPDVLPDTAFTGKGALDSAPATCSNCKCDPPAGQACTLATDLDPQPGLQPIQVKNQPCGMLATALTALTVPALWDGSCFDDEDLPGGQLCAGAPCNASATSSIPTVSGGSCSPAGGVPTLPPATWSIGGKACSAGAFDATGCESGKACRPKPPAPFVSHVCISKPGDVACPLGSPYSDRHVLYTDLVDTRGCSACVCGGASGGTCQITIHLFSDPALNMCSTEDVFFVAGQCKDIAGNPEVHGRAADVTSPPAGGTCPVTGGGAPAGGASPSGPRTFCCIP